MKYQSGQYLLLTWDSVLRSKKCHLYVKVIDSLSNGHTYVNYYDNLGGNYNSTFNLKEFDIEILDIDEMQFKLLSL
jgi:hypothetical protein